MIVRPESYLQIERFSQVAAAPNLAEAIQLAGAALMVMNEGLTGAGATGDLPEIELSVINDWGSGYLSGRYVVEGGRVLPCLQPGWATFALVLRTAKHEPTPGYNGCELVYDHRPLPVEMRFYAPTKPHSAMVAP